MILGDLRSYDNRSFLFYSNLLENVCSAILPIHTCMHKDHNCVLSSLSSYVVAFLTLHIGNKYID